MTYSAKTDKATPKILAGVLVVAIVGGLLMNSIGGGFAGAMFILYALVFGIHLRQILTASIEQGKQYGSLTAVKGVGKNAWAIYTPVWVIFTALFVVEALLGFRFHLSLNPLCVALFWYLPNVFGARLMYYREARETLRQANVTSSAGQGVGGSALTAERDYSSAPMPTTATSRSDAVTVISAQTPEPVTPSKPRRTVIEAEED